MARHRVHYEIYLSEPNESDTQGDSILACGVEYAERTATLSALVTCKNCLRNIAKEAKKQEERQLARTQHPDDPF